MSLEKGGRADKAGNSYENGILAELLIELIRERADSIEVEPLGEEGRGIEFIVGRENGVREYYQCKASNANHPHWRPADLAELAVFRNAKLHIMRGDGQKRTYHFKSPVAYDELDALCDRARTSRDAEDFILHQLTNNSLRNWWDACCAYFCESAIHTFYLLSNCYFVLSPDTREQSQRLEQHLSLIFVEKAEVSRRQILVILKNYINEERLWGRRLTASDVIQSLERYGLRLRIQESDPRILSRVQKINRRSRNNYSPIGDELFPREETNAILEHIHNGESVLLLGRAGAGKSGCFQELMQKLDAEKGLHLTLALDRFPSSVRTAAQYGESEGFPDSPVLCMHRISGGKPVVILFDQLDSLRWMNGTTANALDVCKEMIEEADCLNEFEGGHISIVFAARKFDYETDPGIRSLFEKRRVSKAVWAKVEVGLLSEAKVRELTGEAFPFLSPKLRELLRVPANLYIWLNLGDAHRDQISSLRQLIDQWWLEVKRKCLNQGAGTERIDQCRNKLVSIMRNRERFDVPSLAIGDYFREVDLLCSFGVLKRENNKIRFAHQSFFDYFSVSRQIVDIYSLGCHIPGFYPKRDKQTLDVRYQALMLLQYLMEEEIPVFYDECARMLQSEEVRFYFQCCAFDVLGQMESPDDVTWAFLRTYLYDEKWRTYMLRTVFFAHPAFIRLLFERDRDFSWCDDEGRILLRSIMERGSDLAIDMIEEIGIERFAVEGLYDTLKADRNCSSARGFEMRKELLRGHTELLRNDFEIYQMIEEKLPQAVDMLLILVEAGPEIRATSYLPDERKLRDFSARNAASIAERLAPAVFHKADQEREGKFPWQSPWFDRSPRVTCERGLITIVQMADSWLAENEPESFLARIRELHVLTSLEVEIILHAMEKLPVTHADAALEWLTSDFAHRALDETSGEKSQLSACQRAIQRFSPHCDEAIFRRLEDMICRWSPSLDIMRRVMEYRLDLRKKGNWDCFPAFWGDLQMMLLPALDAQRTSRSTKALLAVLERKFPHGTRFYDNRPISSAEFVSSPVDEHIHKLSNKNWLSIIRDVSSGRVKEGRLNWARGISASPEMFARSLYSAAKDEPLRFAQLALQFPEDTYDGFRSEIVRACESKEVPLGLACEVLRKLCRNPSRGVAIALSWLIDRRANEDWPEDILDMLIDIARNHPDSEGNSYSMHGMNADRDTTCDDLRQSSINCARGSALCAISDHIWQHPEERERFEDILRASVEDVNPAVSFAAMCCVYAWYNIDRALTKELFDKLLEHEPRALYLEEAGRLIVQFYDEDREKYRSILLAAVDSPIAELHPMAARLIAALAMRDDWMLECLLAMPLDEQKANAVFDEAIWMFKSESYHAFGKRLLLHLIARNAASHNAARLFADRALDLEEDKDILEKLIFSGDAHILHRALEYVYETDGCITNYVNVFSAYIQNELQTVDFYFELEYLAKCTARAFQQGKGDARVRHMCLDIWDALFLRFPLEMKAISEKME